MEDEQKVNRQYIDQEQCIYCGATIRDAEHRGLLSVARAEKPGHTHCADIRRHR
jgi:hypothetical protein